MAVGDFVQGAIGGYQFVDDQFRKSEHDQQRRMAIQTDEERYRDERLRQQRRDIESANHAAFGRDQVRRQTAIADANLALNRENQQIAHRRAAIQDQQAAERHNWERQRLQIAQQDQARAKLRDEAVFYAQRAMAGGSPFPKEMHEQLVEAGMPYLSFYDGIERPDEHQAVLKMGPTLDRVFRGDVAAINEQESIDAINMIFADQIKTGIGEYNRDKGATVVDKRIAQFAAGPNGRFAAILEVTLDNGETYLAPRTRHSSTDEEDPVRLIDAGIALDDIVGRYNLALAQQQNRESIASQYRAVFGALPGEQSRQPSLERTTNALTGESEFFTWDGQHLDRVVPRESVNVPPEAVSELMQDPSPQAIAEFDEVFGEGAASRYVGNARTAIGQPRLDTSGLDRVMRGESHPSGEMEVSTDQLTPDQVRQVQQEVAEISRARRAGRRAGEDVRFVIDEQGRLVKISVDALSYPMRQGYRLLSGFIEGVGEFVGGALEGDQQ